ncbi:MAG: hypothetical protein JW759_02505 [Candidatus Coatesbacteria bacterium]|nr:hypothetical protein [Candidatus Coatesbacteria bacterium]
MNRNPESNDWVLIVLAAAFLAIVALMAADLESIPADLGLASIETPAAEIFLLRDEWLGSPEFKLKQPLCDRASLQFFNQLALRPSLDTAPDWLGRRMKAALDKAFASAASTPPEPMRIEL